MWYFKKIGQVLAVIPQSMFVILNEIIQLLTYRCGLYPTFLTKVIWVFTSLVSLYISFFQFKTSADESGANGTEGF